MLLITAILISTTIDAQFVYKIKADSVLITNDSCTAELIVENSTKNVPGFLFNKGRGRTEFRRAVLRINDSLYLIGSDTLRVGNPNAWLQGGNAFGTTGILGTLDNNHLDFYTNNTQRGRWTNTGSLLLGTSTDLDDNAVLQAAGSGLLHGPVDAGVRLLWGDHTTTNVLGARAYGDSYGENHYGVVGVNLIEPYSLYNQAKQGGGIYFDDRSGVLPVRMMYKPANSSLSAFGAGVTVNGNFIVGEQADNGYKLQVMGTGGVFVNPNLSRANDRIRIGGLINTDDGQNALFSTSSDGGATYRNILVERDGFIGIGSGAPFGWWVGAPPLRVFPNSVMSFMSPALYYGNTGGPYNASALVTAVSNTNEWQENLGNYPNGQNYYYFGTVLGTPEGSNKRAPLQISGRDLQFLTGAVDAEAGRFSEAGNLLLGGTSDNGDKLQITKAQNAGTQIHITNTSSGLYAYAGLQLTSEGGSGYLYRISNDYVGSLSNATILQDNAGGDIVLYGGNEIARFKNNGSVGIGTTIPSAQLHTTGSVRFAGLTNDNTQTRVVVSDADGNLYYRNLNTWATNGVINSSLAVNGELSAQKVKVMPETWADFVFDPQYQLPTLTELEQYIRLHQHLPGIPAATEVAKKGIDVGDTQAALLKKIEELSLYMIEQDKELKSLRQEIELLKRRKGHGR